MMKAGWHHPHSIGRLELTTRHLCKEKGRQLTNGMSRPRTEPLHRKMLIVRLELNLPQRKSSLGKRQETIPAIALLTTTQARQALKPNQLTICSLSKKPRNLLRGQCLNFPYPAAKY